MRQEVREYQSGNKTVSEQINRDLRTARGALTVHSVALASESHVSSSQGPLMYGNISSTNVYSTETLRALVVFQVVDPPVVPSPLITR